MKNNILWAIFTTGILCASSSQAQTTLYGVTTANAIFTMSNVNTPADINGPYSISGIASGQVLAGIGIRPGNGVLYALGYDSVAGNAELYTVSNSGATYTAAAVSGTLASMNLGSTTNAAISFIPTSDNQIRVIGRNGNNYVMSASSGAITGTGASGLSFAVGDLYASSSSIIAATAYTNNFYGADATDEIGYDAVNNVLVKMDTGIYLNGFTNTSNTLHSIGAATGVVFTTGGSMGMAAWFDTTSRSNMIYMTGNTLITGAHLYQYDLSSATGALTDLGAIGSGSLTVRAIAFSALGPSTAPVIGHQVTGLSLNLRKLIFFDSQEPENISNVVALTGITSGQSMIGIDYSSNGNLYGLGYNSGSQTYQLYTIDSATGAVTAVNASPFALNLGSDDGSGNYINAAFRFIATDTSIIRVLGNSGTVNVQINAATGAVIETDTAIQYAAGDLNFGVMPAITSVAYTGYSEDTGTHMFGFDANTGDMVMFDANNTDAGWGIGSSGYISTYISLSGILSLLTHTTAYDNAYMNIAYDVSSASNIGFIASNYLGDSESSQGNYGMVYDMSGMLTGYHRGTAATPVPTGTIGYGTPVKDITVRRAAIYPAAIANVTVNIANNLLVYPNPTLSDTYINLPETSTTVVSVYVIDLNGRINCTYQYAPGATQLDVDMTMLPAGLYSLRVYDPTAGYYNLKVVKQ